MKHQPILFLAALLLLLFSMVVPQGCTYDTGLIAGPELPPVDTTQQISFSLDILPIFDQDCSISGCHNGAVAPDLTAANAYSELIEGGYIDTVTPEESELIQWLIGNRNLPMPLTGPDDDLNAKVLTWIIQGAKDN